MNNMTCIVRDPKIVNGQPIFKGNSVTLRTVLAGLAAYHFLTADTERRLRIVDAS
jgi:uncharacterized protein (DUF433 family)